MGTHRGTSRELQWCRRLAPPPDVRRTRSKTRRAGNGLGLAQQTSGLLQPKGQGQAQGHELLLPPSLRPGRRSRARRRRHVRARRNPHREGRQTAHAIRTRSQESHSHGSKARHGRRHVPQEGHEGTAAKDPFSFHAVDHRDSAHPRAHRCGARNGDGPCVWDQRVEVGDMGRRRVLVAQVRLSGVDGRRAAQPAARRRDQSLRGTNEATCRFQRPEGRSPLYDPRLHPCTPTRRLPCRVEHPRHETGQRTPWGHREAAVRAVQGRRHVRCGDQDRHAAHGARRGAAPRPPTNASTW